MLCYTGWVQKNGPPSFRSSDYSLALIASIQLNELFITNLSSNEVQCVSIEQLELKVHNKMCFQSDPNFYVFEQNLRGWGFVCKVT